MVPVFLLYLLKVTICSGLLVAYYWLALRNEEFHYYNRFYLLAAVVASIVLPMLRLDWFRFASDNNQAIQFFHLLYAPASTAGQQHSAAWDLNTYIVYGLSFVCGVMLLMMFARITHVLRLKRRFPVETTPEFDFIRTDLKEAPFSFFRNIFWRSDISVDDGTGRQILQHEITHVQERHSADKLLLQFLLCFFWMNPFFWVIRKELFLIHEFIADRRAVKGRDAADFARMLLRAQYGEVIPAPAQSFFYSPIKRRLIMLTSSRKSRYQYARRLVSLPLFAGIVVLFAFRIDMQSGALQSQPRQTVNEQELNTVPKDSVLYVVDGKTVDASVVASLDPNKIASMHVWKGAEAVRKFGEKGKNGVVEITTKKSNAPGVDRANTSMTEPQFPGGADGWKKFLEQNLRTDVLVQRHAPPGKYTVIVSFTVDKNGNVSDAKALNDPGYGTASEAVRFISTTKWIPANVDGQPVASEARQSITFMIS